MEKGEIDVDMGDGWGRWEGRRGGKKGCGRNKGEME